MIEKPHENLKPRSAQNVRATRPLRDMQSVAHNE